MVLLAGLLLVAWFVVTFLYVPYYSILRELLFPKDGDVGSVVADLMSSARVQHAMRDTLIVTVISVVTTNVVGIAQTFLLEAVDLAGRRVLLLAYAVPLVFGSVSAVTGYETVYGANGVLTKAIRSVVPAVPADWFSGMAAVIVVHTFTLTGFHFLFLRPAIQRVDFSMVEAARSLGMNPVRAILRVVVPVLRPTIGACTLLVLIMSLGSFAAPHILGGGGFTMVGPLISTLTGLGRSDMAALLGFALGAVTVAVMLWALRLERHAHPASMSKMPQPFQRVRLHNPFIRVTAHAIGYILAVVNLAPLLVTGMLSLLPAEVVRNGELVGPLTLENYIRVLTTGDVSQPLVTSLQLCLIAIPIALLIGTLVAHLAHRYRNRATDALQISLFLPHFLPGVLIALGLLLAFGDTSILVGGAVLVGGFWILPLAYVVLLLPLASRFLRAAYAGLDPAIDEAARSLGARRIRRFLLVTFPLLTPVLIQVAALSFNQTFDEYTVSVMVHNVNNQPFGVALGALVNNPDPGLAGVIPAYIVANTAITLIVVLLADRMADRAARHGVSVSGGAAL
ncbi:iron ABC transporter permease [Saccharopolyspora sp. NPDC050389]|uniref:ABC transporter permease n=1 Tax=Saccharopolyspora sp. NPDC050389 TaxID=3155516 RepID=UPI0033D4187B